MNLWGRRGGLGYRRSCCVHFVEFCGLDVFECGLDRFSGIVFGDV